MRRLYAWLVGGAAGVAAYRLLRRRRSVAAEPAEPDQRAEELRAKLAETKDSSPEPEPQPEAPADVESRRKDVHEAARTAIDEMRGTS